ncbi:type II secretion system pilot lipoprotein GspS [Serratia marcescens]|uniref:type II secretion system pilot lipoprotein GspS n=1 Tax=Serratia marcescens TaxID=615 RepID=UPI0009A4CDA3|nr:type II secretion system pilot lipoprotein GspS [Serratia marcescens]OPJ99450.1 hypothetical protein B1R44_07020 [Serratia marcescens]
MKKYLLSFSILLLAGCATHSATQPEVGLTTSQTEQLATLVAASGYLRDVCAQKNIPNENQLVRSALEQAKHKGWRPGSSAVQNIQAQSEIILSGLKQDKTPVEEKCAYFSKYIGHFLSDAGDIK